MITDFSQLVGNDFVKNCLIRMLEKNAVGHALLFAGIDGIGKGLFAQAVAASLILAEDPEGKHRAKIEKGIHPDIHIYRPEGKLGLHSMQTLRQMCDEVHLPPYEANCKVFIIHEADRMLSYSANALLKTFEEPPPRTKIILLSHSHTALLPTILSRCATFYFEAIEQIKIENYLKQHFQTDEPSLKCWAGLAQGSLGRAIQLAKRGGDPTRQTILKLLSKENNQDFKVITHVCSELVKEIEANRKLVEEESKDYYKDLSSNATAAMLNAIEKEMEGMSAISLVQETGALFSVILSWYRDLHLLAVNGPRNLLINVDCEQALDHAYQRGRLLPLETVQKAIQEAKLALQRSVSLTICLENLFLKLV
jgi:DNA polymerase-3 subunit delta'